MKIHSVVTGVSLLLIVSSTVLAKSDDLSISIGLSDENTQQVMDNPDHRMDLNSEEIQMYVIITSMSDEPVRLWETWNSWGWYNLTFEILDDSGNILYSLEKKSRAWTRNFPSYVSLGSGEQFVIDVCLADSDWELPFQGEERRGSANIRAVYKIPEDGETEEYDVWTGEIESETLRIRY